MEIASGKGEKGDVEKPGTRWEWRRVEREEVGGESSRSINEKQGTGVGEKGEKVKRNYENGDCKKREK